MSMEKVKLVNGYYYHIYNRGVDKRDIFMDKQDYCRFIQYLYECNDKNAITSFGRDLKYRIRNGEIDKNLTSIVIRPRKILVEIISFSLMPNHFHLILKQTNDNGISKFMQKLGTGYTMYFNVKNERTGRLFASKYKCKHIDSDEYLKYLSRYIHLNPVDLIDSGWRERGIRDKDRVNNFLEFYKWSSYLDYIEIHNFPSVINKDQLSCYFKTSGDYKEYIQSWISDDFEVLRDKEVLFGQKKQPK